jgi:hypothetical protein
MRLSLDFTHPRQSPALPGWLLLMAGLLAAGWAGWRYQDVAEGARAEHARLAALTPKPARKVAAVNGSKAPDADLDAARRLLFADWGGLLTAIETSRPDAVAFLTLEGEAVSGSLLLTAEARSPRDMLAYVETLQRLPGLDRVVLASHADQAREGEKAVRFSLRARWRTP